MQYVFMNRLNLFVFLTSVMDQLITRELTSRCVLVCKPMVELIKTAERKKEGKLLV